MMLLLQVLLVIHADIMLERGASGPDHGRPVEGAASNAAAVRTYLDPGDGRERRELGLRLSTVERRRPPGGGRGR